MISKHSHQLSFCEKHLPPPSLFSFLYLFTGPHFPFLLPNSSVISFPPSSIPPSVLLSPFNPFLHLTSHTFLLRLKNIASLICHPLTVQTFAASDMKYKVRYDVYMSHCTELKVYFWLWEHLCDQV